MLGIHLTLREYLDTLQKLLVKLDLFQIRRLADEIHAAWEDGRTVFLCGSGGSGADASHIAADLGKGTLDPLNIDRSDAKRLKVLNLTDNVPAVLAWAEDEGFERVFVEPLKHLAAPDDLLIALCPNGNSPGVQSAVRWANERGLRTWGLTGHYGGDLRGLAQNVLRMPLGDTGIVESAQLLVLHWIVDEVYARINEAGRYSDHSSQ